MARNVSLENKVFASAGIKVDPDTDTSSGADLLTIAGGHIDAQGPYSSHVNYIENRQDALLNLIEKHGILPWSDLTAYEPGALCKVDRTFYQLVEGGDGTQDPSADDGANWEEFTSGGGDSSFVDVQTEEITLALDQTEVSLTNASTSTMELYIEGAREFDFTVTGQKTFELPESFPSGTRIWVVSAEAYADVDSINVTAPTSGDEKTLAEWVDDIQGPDSSLVTAYGTSDTRQLDEWMVPINDPSILAPVATGANTARSLAARFADFINVMDYGAIGDGTFHPLSERFSSLINAQVVYPFVTSLDQGIDWAAWQAALNSARGKGLYSPSLHFMIDQTLVSPAGVTIQGDGRYDYWDTDDTVGTILETYGAGNPQRWTDIDGSDAEDDTPLLVMGGNGCFLSNVTLRGDWSMGALFPCVKQCGTSRFSAFGFTDGCLYLDATWSNRNDTMTNLYPEIETSTGMNEFTAVDNWLIGGGTNGFGLKVQGTTRGGDSVASSSDWKWGWGGTSDIRFYSSRISGTGSNGGCVHHDAQLFGIGSFGQGVSFHACDLRLSGDGKYLASLNRSNRITFDTCYGETTGTSAVFNVTSNTQLGADGVMRVNDKLNCDVYLDDVDTGYGGSNVPWDATRCMTMKRHDGRDWTRNWNPSANSGQVLRVISRHSDGAVYFARDTGSGSPSDYLLVTEDVMRPAVASGMSAGSASFPFLNVRADNVYNSSGIITSSDKNLKQDVSDIGDRVMAAWSKVKPKQYRYIASVEEKGDGARYHFGFIAQDIVEAFESEGLDAFDYGLVGIDRETNHLFVRYEQAAVLDAATAKS